MPLISRQSCRRSDRFSRLQLIWDQLVEGGSTADQINSSRLLWPGSWTARHKNKSPRWCIESRDGTCNIFLYSWTYWFCSDCQRCGQQHLSDCMPKVFLDKSWEETGLGEFYSGASGSFWNPGIRNELHGVVSARKRVYFGLSKFERTYPRALWSNREVCREERPTIHASSSQMPNSTVSRGIAFRVGCNWHPRQIQYELVRGTWRELAESFLAHGLWKARTCSRGLFAWGCWCMSCILPQKLPGSVRTIAGKDSRAVHAMVAQFWTDWRWRG